MYVLFQLYLSLDANETVDHCDDLWCSSPWRRKDDASVFFLQRVSPVHLTRFQFVDIRPRYKV